MKDKIIIGSANFGLKYGIANQKKILSEYITKILTLASKSGVFGLDTAKDYGEAEKIIGDYIDKYKPSFKIITKLSYSKNTSLKSVFKDVEDSLVKLHVSHIDYVLLHSFKMYKKYKSVFVEAFFELKKRGKVRNWGVSLYHPSEAEQLIEDGLTNIAIEFPFNLFDQRFLKDNLLERLKLMKYKLFARSVFLQGLLLLSPAELPHYFKDIKNKIEKLNKLSEIYKMKPAEIALLFPLNQKLINGVIIGVDSQEQLAQNLKCVSKRDHYFKLKTQIDKLAVTDNKIILPYLWPTLEKLKN